MTLREWYICHHPHIANNSNIKIHLYLGDDCEHDKYIGTAVLTGNDIMCLPIGKYNIISFSYDTADNRYNIFNVAVNIDFRDVVEKKKPEKKAEDSYKTRMITEYKELKERYNKLKIMLQKYEHGVLDFKLTCSPHLLYAQFSTMSTYLSILEERARIENVVFYN